MKLSTLFGILSFATLSRFAIGIISFTALSLSGLTALAIDAVNPEALCERYISPVEQKYCQEKINKIKPDWYLASVCQSQFDHDTFYDCLELSSVATFDPLQLEKCEAKDLGDQARLSCLRGIAKFEEKKPTFQRMPASFSTPGKKKASK